MPRGDRTGPSGMGPMTGRSAGYCVGSSNPGYMTQVERRGFYGRGFGRGMGLVYGRDFMSVYQNYFPTHQTQYQNENEIAFLEKELNNLQESMQQIEARLNEINKSKKQ